MSSHECFPFRIFCPSMVTMMSPHECLPSLTQLFSRSRFATMSPHVCSPLRMYAIPFSCALWDIEHYDAHQASRLRLTPAGQGGRLPDPRHHLLLVEIVLVDIDPARVLGLASGWNGA